jgi:hypothetical protein
VKLHSQDEFLHKFLVDHAYLFFLAKYCYSTRIYVF